jgi:hypothetical protein
MTCAQSGGAQTMPAQDEPARRRQQNLVDRPESLDATAKAIGRAWRDRR